MYRHATITIKPGTRAVLSGDIPLEIDHWLRDTFCWAPILELPKLSFFYQNKEMFSGVAFFVKGALESKGYTVELVYERKTPGRPLVPHSFIGTYREGQEEAVNAILEKRRGIVFAPPGYGKTLVMAVAAAKSEVPALIVTQAKEPFDQAFDAFNKFTDLKGFVGRVGAGHRDIKSVNVATIQTLNNGIKNKDKEIMSLIANSRFIAVDECHHSAAESYINLFNNMSSVEYLIGVSATPFRADDKGLLLYVMYGPIIFDKTYTEMVEGDILCPLKIIIKPTPGSSRQAVVPKNKFHARNLYQKIYQEYIVENEDRNLMAVEFAEKLNSAGHTCVIIVSRIDHAYNIQNLIPHAVVLHGKTPKNERTDIIDGLRTHRIKTVISTLFDEAVDVSSLGGVALMAGGKSEVKLIQRLRSTRTFDGTLYDGTSYKKEKGYVLYPKDDAPMLKKHSQQNIKELEKLAKNSKYIEVVKVGDR